MTSWAYGIATAAFFIGIYLMLKLKKWKIGGWIVCLSLAVFAGASINIRNLISVDDAFKYSQQVTQQVSAISNQVSQLKVQMTQSLILTQQMSQTVNLVTEVRKEVADVRELIIELYSRTRVEIISPSDTNLLYFAKEDGAHIACVLLKNVPIQASIAVVASSSKSGQVPILPGSVRCKGNVMALQWGKGTTVTGEYSYAISYVIDPKNTNYYTTVTYRDNDFHVGERLRRSEQRQ